MPTPDTKTTVDPHPEAVRVVAEALQQAMGCGGRTAWEPEARMYVLALIAAGYTQLAEGPKRGET